MFRNGQNSSGCNSRHQKYVFSENPTSLRIYRSTGFTFFRKGTLLFYNLRSVAPYKYLWKTYVNYLGMFVVKALYAQYTLERLPVFSQFTT